jgi:hypothetical protein
MNSLKEKFGLSTDKGMDYQAVLYLAMGAITTMESGTERTILMLACFGCLAAVAFFTRGSAKKTETIDHEEPIEEVIDRGRE